MTYEITPDDRRRLEGVWDRAKVIGGVNGYPQLGVGFNDDEDVMVVMAAMGRISRWWVEKHTQRGATP